MYEVTICDSGSSFHTFMCRNFSFSNVAFIMDVYDNPETLEIKTMFFPLIHVKFIESKSVALAHEENEDEITPD